MRDRLGRIDPHGIAREAIALLRSSGAFWGERPVFLYGLDDLTGNQFELIEALAALAEVTFALPYEQGNARPGRARRTAGAPARARRRRGDAHRGRPRNTANPLLFHLERSFGAIDAERRAPGDGA